MRPLVSVIMPVYNSKATIKRAVDSVFDQDVDLELIIVDDASKDDSYDLIKDRVDDERFYYYRNFENKGVAYSRNFGIDKAKGKYIAFLDSDDVWRKGKLKNQIALLEETKAVLCGTARELMRYDGSLTGKIIRVPESIDFKGLLKGNVINCSSVLVLSELMKNYPMTDDDLHEDYITWLRILKNHGRAVFLKDAYLLYRVSSGSKSGNKFRSAKATYGVYRRLGFNLPSALYYFIRYVISAVIKYSV